MQFRQFLIPEGAPNHPNADLVTSLGPIGFTVHETDNARVGADAMNHGVYVRTPEAIQRQVAYHGAVDDHEFVQTLPFDKIGWHAADGCENRLTDIGCFRTIGIEGCVNSDGNEAQMRLNFAETIARIHLGQNMFNWGDGHTKGKFSIDYIWQHIQVAQNFPPHHCPDHMLNDNYWQTFMIEIDKAVERLSGVALPAPEPTPLLPRGMGERMAEKLFGRVNAIDGHVYSFNLKGSRSKRWVEHGKLSMEGTDWKTGSWPALLNVIIVGDGGKGSKLLQYSDGWIDDGYSKVA